MLIVNCHHVSCISYISLEVLHTGCPHTENKWDLGRLWTTADKRDGVSAYADICNIVLTGGFYRQTVFQSVDAD